MSKRKSDKRPKQTKIITVTKLWPQKYWYGEKEPYIGLNKHNVGKRMTHTTSNSDPELREFNCSSNSNKSIKKKIFTHAYGIANNSKIYTRKDGKQKKKPMNLELFPIPFSAPLFTPTLHYVQAIILDRWKVCLKIVFAVDNITFAVFSLNDLLSLNRGMHDQFQK